jgi:hypothetical protein
LCWSWLVYENVYTQIHVLTWALQKLKVKLLLNIYRKKTTSWCSHALNISVLRLDFSCIITKGVVNTLQVIIQINFQYWNITNLEKLILASFTICNPLFTWVLSYICFMLSIHFNKLFISTNVHISTYSNYTEYTEYLTLHSLYYN